MDRSSKKLYSVCPYCRINIVYTIKTNHACIYLTIQKRNKKQEKVIKSKKGTQNKKLLHELKINGCAICGYNKYDAALEFHHVNPENKKYRINRDRVCRKDLINELNKCILLCANCHREIHEKGRLNE